MVMLNLLEKIQNFNEAQNKAKKNGKGLWAGKNGKEVKKPKVKGNKNSKENEFDMNDKKRKKLSKKEFNFELLL